MAMALFFTQTPNAFGRGEKLSLDYTHGMVKSKTHTISFTKPINADPDKWFTAAGFHTHDDRPWSGYGETSRGFGFRFAFPGKTLWWDKLSKIWLISTSHVFPCFWQIRHPYQLLSNSFPHPNPLTADVHPVIDLTLSHCPFPAYGGLNTIHWDVLWRELKALNNGIAFTARNDMGHSLKSAIKHTYTLDTRDTPILPSTGILAKFVNEVSGLGGDVRYDEQSGLKTRSNVSCSCISGIALELSLFLWFKFNAEPYG